MRSVSSMRVPVGRAQAESETVARSASGKISVPRRGSSKQQDDRRASEIDTATTASGSAATRRRYRPYAVAQAPAAPRRDAPSRINHVEKHRHQGAREQVRRDHREPDRQRERHEELPCRRPTMKNEGTNTARMQNIESRRADGGSAARPRRRPRARETPGSMCVWMFSISTVASSTSTPTASARPPSVMMLIVWPVSPEQHHGAEQRERNVEHDDQRAAPVAQEEQHHQAGEQPRRAALRSPGRESQLVT